MHSHYERLFNAQHFPLAGIHPRDVRLHLDLALQWVRDPFGITRGGLAIQRQNLYGYDAAVSRPAAAMKHELDKGGWDPGGWVIFEKVVRQDCLFQKIGF